MHIFSNSTTNALISKRLFTRPDQFVAIQLRNYKSNWEAYRNIDWGKAEGKLYVVLDPCDSTLLEYLTPTEYRSLRKQCISNDIQLEVIANPKSDPLSNPHRAPNGDQGPVTSNDKVGKGTDTKPDQVK